MSVCLVIFQNHQYTRNIEVLDRLYGERFDHIVHVVPFYDGSRDDVIPVYENSYYFEGYVAQVARELKSMGHSHYIFIADDLILNPIVSQENYKWCFDLANEEACFHHGFVEFGGLQGRWDRAREAALWTLNVKGVEAQGQLPSVDEAIERFHAHGLSFDAVPRSGLVYRGPSFASLRSAELSPRLFTRRWLGVARNNYRDAKIILGDGTLEYPLVGGYSDIFVVSGAVLQQFAHYCGVFAATNLQVEIALPTSLVLSASSISTEASTPLKGKAIWSEEEGVALENYRPELRTFLSNFPADQMYVHPLKLSQWKYEVDL